MHFLSYTIIIIHGPVQTPLPIANAAGCVDKYSSASQTMQAPHVHALLQGKSSSK